MNLKDALMELAHQTGLPIALSEHGTAQLLFDQRLAVNLEASGDQGVYLYAVLGPLPSDQREAMYAMLLEGQLFGQETSLASFGLDSTRGELLLHRYLDLSRIEYSDFILALDDFIERHAYWLDRLASTLPSRPPAPAPGNEPPEPYLANFAIRV